MREVHISITAKALTPYALRPLVWSREWRHEQVLLDSLLLLSKEVSFTRLNEINSKKLQKKHVSFGLRFLLVNLLF